MVIFSINNQKSILKFFLITGSLAVVLIPGNYSQAATLVDWDTIGWQDGDLNQDFQFGDSIININFELGSEAQFTNFQGGAMTPSVSGTLNGSNPDSDQSLHLQLNASKVGAFQDDTTPYSAMMNVIFFDSNRLFSGVFFNLYDVDKSGNGLWQDRVSVKGIANGQIVDPVFNIQNTAHVKQVDNHTLDGIQNSGNNQDSSNVSVAFSNPISGFQLIFTDGDDISSNIDPDPHGIGVGDIYYLDDVKNVPEPITGLVFAAGLGGAALRRCKTSKQS